MSHPQPQPDPAAVAALLDRQAISDCLVRYARGVDRLDQDLIRSAFWEDAHDAHGQIAGSVDDFLASWWPRQSAREVAQHLLANQAIELGADAAEKVVLGDTFMEFFNSHTHPTGVGPSGPPAQPMSSSQLSSANTTQ